MRTYSTLAILLILTGAHQAYAHRYVPSDGNHSSAATAITIADTDLSQVVYHEIGANGSGNVWLTFDGTAGQSLFIQIGVPRLTRLEGYRPAVALVGPGLGSDTVPFDVPEGLGVRVFATTDRTPEPFDEEFTGTESWILLEETTTLPADGTFYLVAYDPAGEGGKMYVAVGQREEFGFADILTFGDVVRAVRTFHEVAEERPPLLTRALLFVSRVANFVTGFFG